MDFNIYKSFKINKEGNVFHFQGFYCSLCESQVEETLEDLDNHIISEDHVENLERQVMIPFETLIVTKDCQIQCTCCKQEFDSLRKANFHRLTMIHVKNVIMVIQNHDLQAKNSSHSFNTFESKQSDSIKSLNQREILQYPQFEVVEQNKTIQQNQNSQILKKQQSEGKCQTEQFQVQTKARKAGKDELVEEKLINDEKEITLSFYNMEALSKETLNRYLWFSNQFLQFLDKEKLPRIRQSLRKQHIINYLGNSKGQALKLAALNSLSKANQVEVDWSSKDYKKQLKKTKTHHCWSHEKIKEIVLKLDKEFPLIALYVAFLYKFAASVQDLMSVKVCHLYDEKITWEPNKSQKYHQKRTVKNSKWVRNRIVNLKFSEEAYNETLVQHSQTSSKVIKQIRYALDKINEPNVQTYDFRTSRLKYLLTIKQIDLPEISIWVGHRSIETTCKYFSSIVVDDNITKQTRQVKKKKSEKNKKAKEASVSSISSVSSELSESSLNLEKIKKKTNL